MIELTGHFDGCGLTEACRVFVTDEPHPVNGAHHRYMLTRTMTVVEMAAMQARDPHTVPPPAVTSGALHFQRGPRNELDSTPGTLDGAVLSVLIHRQECFQAGPFACPENDEILAHLTAARDLLIKRAQERKARGVLGKNEK